jgi:putative phage-type endonuclease
MNSARSKAWVEERRKGIGGSDMPVILGVSPFKTKRELWLEKTGRMPDPEPTPAMERGRHLEDMIAHIYAQKTGRRVVRRRKAIVHPHFEFLRANIDRQIQSTNGKGPGVLEIKAPGLHVFSKCKREGLPAYYFVQLQHYLTVTGRQWGSFMVFSAERWDGIHFDIDYDPGLSDLMVERADEFWHTVEQGIEPKEDDGPELDLPSVGGEMVRIETPAWAAAVEGLRVAKDLSAEAKALEDEAKAEVQRLMQEAGADVAEGAGARIYWKEQAGRKSLDKKRLEAEHPEIDLSHYMKAGKPFRTFRSYWLNEREVE